MARLMSPLEHHAREERCKAKARARSGKHVFEPDAGGVRCKHCLLTWTKYWQPLARPTLSASERDAQDVSRDSK